MKEEDWEDYYRSESKAEVGIVTIPIVLVIFFALICHFFYRFLIKADLKMKSKYVKWSTIGNLSFNILFVLYQFLVYVLGPTVPIHYGCVSAVLGSNFLGLGRLFLYFFLLARLHETFANTDLRYNPLMLKFTAGLCTFTIITSTIVYIGWWMSDCRANLGIYPSLYAMVQDFLWSVFFLFLFSRQLYKTTERIMGNEQWSDDILKPTSPKSMSNSKSNSIKSVSNLYLSTRFRAARFIYLIFKLTLLTLISIMSTWILIGWLYDINGPLLYCIDAMINSFCLILCYTVYNKWYRIVCYPCRISCESLFLRCLKLEDLDLKKIEKEMENESSRKNSKRNMTMTQTLSKSGPSSKQPLELFTADQSGDNDTNTTETV